jgi:hypothetical protein
MNQTKTKKLIVEKILKQGGGKIQVENILSYLTDHTADFADLDLVNKKWVLDQLTGVDETALFFGYFDTETSLVEASTADVQDGAWALVGTETTFAHYDWDLIAQEWKVITGEKGDPGTVDLPALDARYLRKDENDSTPHIVSFGKIILTSTVTDDQNFVEYLGRKADGTIVGITPAVISGDKSVKFTVASASDTWQINHKMGKFPCFAIKDSTGNPQYPNWEWVDNNVIRFYFDGIVSGGGVLN